MRLAEGEAANKHLEGWQHVEIWGNKHYIILPPSVHPSGVIYQWETPEPYYNLPDYEKPPLVSVTALDWLGVDRATAGATWQAPELLGLPDWTVNLSRNNRRILSRAIDGSIPEGQRNTELVKPIYDIAAMIQGGAIDYRTGWEVIESAAEGLRYPVKAARSMLRSGLNKPGLTRSRDGAEIKPKPYEQALTFAAAHNWPARTGHTDKAVFLACCERAKVDAGQGSFRAASREIAQLANKTRKTASKALHRLTASDLLYRVISDPSGANRYRFGKTVRRYSTNPTCSYSGVLTNEQKTHNNPQTPAQMDVFGRLGAVSWAVYSWLTDNYASSYKEIAEATGQNVASIRRVLSRGKNTGALIRHGLVIYNPADNTYHAEQATEDKLERIAAVLGVLGRSDKRERSHQAERGLRVNHLLYGAIRNYEKKRTK